MLNVRIRHLYLLFPPFTLSNLAGPYLSIPMLEGFLKKNTDHEIISIDLNLALVKKMLRSDNIKTQFEKSPFSHKYNLQKILFKAWLFRHNVYYNDQVKYRTFLMQLLKLYFSDEHFDIAEYISKSNSEILKTDLNQILNNNSVSNIYIRFLGEDFVKKIISSERCTAAFSIAYFSQLLPALEFAKIIKAINGNNKIIFGGNTILLIKDVLKRYPDFFSIIDYFVYGTGEETLAKLVNNIDNEKQIKTIPNLIYCNKGKVVINEHKQFNINNSTSPDFTILKTNGYFNAKYKNNLILPMRTALGCYWSNCAFCTLSLVKYNQRKLDLVIQDIKEIYKKYKPAHFWFVDLSISSIRLKKIAQAIIANNLKIKWRCFTRFEKGFDYETCKLLSKSGCFVLTFGLESGNIRVNRLMNKGFELSLAEQVLRNLTRAGIRASVAAIIGFPTETQEETMDTFKFFMKNWKYIHYNSINIFGLNCNSHVYFNPEKFGITKIYDSDEHFFIRNFKYDVKSGISTQQAAELLNKNYSSLQKTRLKKYYQKIYRIFRKIVLKLT